MVAELTRAFGAGMSVPVQVWCGLAPIDRGFQSRVKHASSPRIRPPVRVRECAQDRRLVYSFCGCVRSMRPAICRLATWRVTAIRAAISLRRRLEAVGSNLRGYVNGQMLGSPASDRPASWETAVADYDDFVAVVHRGVPLGASVSMAGVCALAKTSLECGKKC
jgi:hypothetical protein